MIQRENTYCEHFTVPSYMVDGKLRITPSFLFNIMQEIAVNHVHSVGIGWNHLHEEQKFWALSRMDVEILRRPEWNEKLEITTWGKKHNFLVQPRDFWIENDNGEVLVKATSNWVILDLDGKPQLLSNFEPRLKNQHDIHAIERATSRLSAVTLEEDKTFKPVVYSDIDMNCHANNGAYVTWVMDNFSHDFHQKHELIGISINYLQQTKNDECYAIQQQEIAPNEFLASIYTQKSKVEVCRVRTKWI